MEYLYVAATLIVADFLLIRWNYVFCVYVPSKLESFEEYFTKFLYSKLNLGVVLALFRLAFLCSELLQNNSEWPGTVYYKQYYSNN